MPFERASHFAGLAIQRDEAAHLAAPFNRHVCACRGRIMKSRIHYQANICGGDFQHVKQCFIEWKQQPLVYRMNQHMFEGKREVRPLSGDRVFHNGEVALRALTSTCGPHDAYALAAQVHDGDLRGVSQLRVIASCR